MATFHETEPDMKIRNMKELDARIRDLEERKEIQEELIAAEFKNLRYELQPASLIRSAWNNLKQSPEYRTRLMENAAELGMNMLANRMTGGSSRSLLSSLLRAGTQMGLDKLAEKHSDRIRAYGTAIFNSVFKRKGTT